MLSASLWFAAATLASVAAGLVIEAILALIAVRGLSAAFSNMGLAALALLIAVGVIAYAGYTLWAREAREVMRRVSPAALVLAGAGVASYAAGLTGPQGAGLFIVAAYLVELVVGYKLARDFARVDRAAARLFLAGVTVYVATLPLVLLDYRLALAPLAGNTVKVAGLAVLAAKWRAAGENPQSSMKASRPLLAESPAAL